MSHARSLGRVAVLLFWMGCVALPVTRSQELPTTNPAAVSSAADANGPDPEDTSPILATRGTWAGAMVIVVLGLFFAAAVIGPMVLAEAAPTMPNTVSHHEDPSHHTGREPDTVPLPHGGNVENGDKPASVE